MGAHIVGMTSTLTRQWYALAAVALGIAVSWGANAAGGTLTPHEEYIAQYRALGAAGKVEEREKLEQEFLAEAEAYITAHPDGAEIVQAKLNKALALGLYGERRDAESDGLLKRILLDHPESPLVPEIMFQRAWLLGLAFGSERDEEKREIALELCERFPKSPKAPYALSLAAHSYLVDAGDPETAAALLRRVIEEYPGTGAELNSRRDLIRIAADAGDVGSVQQQVDAFLERFQEAPEIIPPESWTYRLTAEVAQSCARIGDWNRATRCSEVVRAAWPDAYQRFVAELRLIDTAFDREDFDTVRQRIDAFDRALTDYIREPWALRAQLDLAMLIRRHSLYLSRRQFRQEGVARLQEIADTHPGSAEAAESLTVLISNYIFDEPDLDRARALNVRLLTQAPSRNARQCATNVRRMMAIGSASATDDGEYFLIQLRRPQVREKARQVIRLYPKLSSSGRRRFINNADSLLQSREVEQTIAKIIRYAERRNDHDLLKEALLLQAECYLIKWQPEEATAWCDFVLADHRTLLSQDDVFRLRDCRAMSLFWGKRYGEALACFQELEADASERVGARADEQRTTAFYAYMQALTYFLDGDYAKGKSAFADVIRMHPSTTWAKRSRSYIDSINPLLAVLASAADEQ